MKSKTKIILKFFSLFVALVLVALAVWGVTGRLDKKGISVTVTSDLGSEMDVGGMMTSEVTEGQDISLTSYTVSAEQFEEYGVMPIADSAQVLTATVLPVNEATNTKVSWTAAWKDPSSEWARSRTLSAYLSLSYGDSVSSSKQCTVTCLQAFGEPIVITVKAVDKPTVYTTVQADYVQKVTDFSLSFGTVNCFWGAYTNVTLEAGSGGSPVGGMPKLTSTTSSAYTIPVEFDVVYKLEAAREDQVFASGKFAYFGTNYVGFFRYISDDTAPEKYDFSSYDVENKGLYFSAKFLHENMCFDDYLDLGDTHTQYRQEGYDTLCKLIYSSYHPLDAILPQYTDYLHNNVLFKLTVDFTSKRDGTKLSKSTMFNASNVIYSTEISGVQTDRNNIEF